GLERAGERLLLAGERAVRGGVAGVRLGGRGGDLLRLVLRLLDGRGGERLDAGRVADRTAVLGGLRAHRRRRARDQRRARGLVDVERVAFAVHVQRDADADRALGLLAVWTGGRCAGGACGRELLLLLALPGGLGLLLEPLGLGRGVLVLLRDVGAVRLL